MDLNIPVIDLGLCHGQLNANADWALIAKDFGRALHEIGFAYLENHGIPQNCIDDAFAVNMRFFELPQAVKVKYRKRMPENYHGYSEPGQEQLQSKSIFELKETFDIWGDRQFFPGPEVPQFEPAMGRLRNECQTLARTLFKLLGLALELEDVDYFLKCGAGLEIGSPVSNASLLRSIFYPKVGDLSRLQVGTTRCGEHTDYDMFTMLFQDASGGLELKSNSVWRHVKLRPGAILLNIGETLEIISGGYFPATEHRVRIPDTDKQQASSRLSIGYFVYPDTDTVHQPQSKKDGSLVADFEPFDPIKRGLEKAEGTYNY